MGAAAVIADGLEADAVMTVVLEPGLGRRARDDGPQGVHGRRRFDEAFAIRTGCGPTGPTT
jgi:hypothetical protein